MKTLGLIAWGLPKTIYQEALFLLPSKGYPGDTSGLSSYPFGYHS